MKKTKILKIMKDLIDSENVEFIPLEQANMIYIDYYCTQNDLKSAYEASKRIAKMFVTKVIFHFNGFDILVDKKTTMKDVEIQYNKAHEEHYRFYVQNEFKKTVKNLNVKNAKRKTKEVFRLIKDENGFRKYISDYQLSSLSNALYKGYKINQPDPYLDNMVETAKTLIKK